MSGFGKNVAIMSFAPLVTQVLSILVTPVITRYYSPDDFAVVAVFASIVGPIGIFSTMGYSSAIILPKVEKEAVNLFSLCLVITLLTALVVSPVIFLKNSPILSWMNVSEIQDYLWLIPIGLITDGVYQSLRYWNIRNRRFGHITAAKISRFIANNGLILFWGFTGNASGAGMVLSGLAGGVASPAVLSESVWRKHKQNFLDLISFKEMWNVAKGYSKFAKILPLNDFLSRISSQVPIYIFAIYFSQVTIGYYALGLRLLTVPINFLGNSIGEVFFQEASYRREEIHVILDKLFKYLVLIGLPVFVFLGLFGKECFNILFGSNWYEAGVFAQILSLYMFTQFITIPASYLMLIFQKQEYSIYLNIATVAVSSISLFLGGIYNDVYLALILFSLSNSIIYIIFGFGFMKYAGLTITTMLQVLKDTLLISMPFIGVILCIKYFIGNNALLLVILSGMALVIFYIIIVFRSPELSGFVKVMMRKLKSKYGNK